VRTINGTTILEAVKDSDAVIATATLFSGMYAVALPGQRISYRNPLVRQHPECFVPVLGPNVDPDAAVRCVSAVDQRSSQPDAPPWATERLCWPGQLLPDDDPVVLAYPDRFAPPGGS